MARFLINPSGDVVLAMSVTESMGLLAMASGSGIAPTFDSPSQQRAANRALENLAIAVGTAKSKGHARPLHSQKEALKRMDSRDVGGPP